MVLLVCCQGLGERRVVMLLFVYEPSMPKSWVPMMKR